MFKDLKVTLYEVFGYILPGSILGLAVCLTFTNIFTANTTIPMVPLSTELKVIIVVMLYFSGHIVQAIGNIGVNVIGYTDEYICQQIYKKTPDLVDIVSTDIHEKLGISATDISLSTLLIIADQANVQHGNIDNRDIFIYREGFYRGLSVSCLIITIALTIRLFLPAISFVINNNIVSITNGMLLYVIGMSAIGTILFYNRYKRFANYRINNALLSYLVNSKLK